MCPAWECCVFGNAGDEWMLTNVAWCARLDAQDYTSHTSYLTFSTPTLIKFHLLSKDNHIAKLKFTACKKGVVMELTSIMYSPSHVPYRYYGLLVSYHLIGLSKYALIHFLGPKMTTYTQKLNCFFSPTNQRSYIG